MTPERWQQVKDILYGALQKEPNERSAFLGATCQTDSSLRLEVESLLASKQEAIEEFLQSASPEQAGIAKGTRLGPYEIVCLIGAGGMGEVYRARDTRLNREVAIKVLPRIHTSDSERRQRFRREAQAISSLQHPNICTLFDVGQHDAIDFLVMEYLEGETLAACLRKGRLALDLTIRYAAELADALDAAHRRGIIHRDLKPANIFLTVHGESKVLDFGLAKLEDPGPDLGRVDSTAIDLKLQTTPGVAMGTAAYMSPEQARGEELDQRTDIFSSGAVLYEMATGAIAFPGKTPAMVHKAILDDTPPSPSRAIPSLPEALDRIVGKCLEKDRELRYQSAADLRADLHRIKRDSASGRVMAADRNPMFSRYASATSKPKFARMKWLVWTFLILVTTAVGRWWYLHRAGQSQLHLSPASMRIKALTKSGKASSGAVSMDGHYVGYVRREPGKNELHLLQVATERDVPVLEGSSLRIWSIHFSPDGNFVYFLRELKQQNGPKATGVYRIAALGGPATPLALDADGESVTVSPDGKQLAYISHSQDESYIIGIDVDGGNRHILARRPIQSSFWFIEWSHSLNRLAAVAIGKDDMGMVSVELPSGTIRDLAVTGWGAVGQPAWSPDDHEIYAPAVEQGGAIMQIWAIDAQTGTHKPLTSNSTNYSQWSLSATGNGELLANTYTEGLTLWTTDRPTKMHQIPSLPNEGSESVIWVDNSIVSSDIIDMLVHDGDGHDPTKIRSYSGIYRDLARCGPGQVVYWANDKRRSSHVAQTDITSGSTTALTDGPLDGGPTCTADGSTMLYIRSLKSGGGRNFLMSKSLNSGQSVQLYEFDKSEPNSPTISPDGRNVLFIVEHYNREPAEWMIMPITGGNPSKLQLPVSIDEVRAFKWGADSKSIVYAKNDNGIGNIWSVPLSGGHPKKLTDFHSERIFSFDVSPADGRLVVSRGDFVIDLVLIENAR